MNEDFPGGFRRETLTRKARNRNPLRPRQDRRKENRRAARTGFCRAATRRKPARHFVENARRRRENDCPPGLGPRLRAPSRLSGRVGFVGSAVYHPRQKFRPKRRPLPPKFVVNFVATVYRPRQTVDHPRQKSWSGARLAVLELCRWFLSRPSIAHIWPSIAHNNPSIAHIGPSIAHKKPSIAHKVSHNIL